MPDAGDCVKCGFSAGSIIAPYIAEVAAEAEPPVLKFSRRKLVGRINV